MTILRTTSENADFQFLVSKLDACLAEINGSDHAFYNQFNSIAALQHVVVAYDDGIPVGCGGLKQVDHESVEIKRMYVDPAQRDRGVGGAVLAALEAWTLELGFRACVLETSVKLPAAVHLYCKHGYERTPNYGQYVDMPDSVCFRKNLTA
ncbi:GNAT family N-acetyltransferase [Fibrella sp. HMF5335]|uniref:GNAT family N-acetyltransferase n=1 Tax=Fibrella rubiginis TaxID=2817060 RepID=A0A939K3V6_9BACT|nr:GNAT family N-acetyltransferase [Fibrella rubiginis]MBO0937779.1 GNAT family N-acetyltransferase [Fibrella rubiginis]